ncbi:MAG: radical SAM protein [Phycisphaerales bacterium]
MQAPAPENNGSVLQLDLCERIERAESGLARCEVCELRCGANRLNGEPAPCGLGAESYTYKRHLSLAEEVELLPAYLVYLSGCNMRCRFCIQGHDCFDPRRGEQVNPDTLAAELGCAIDRGTKTITFIGGEPGLHPHTILRVAEAAGRRMPIALKTNLYLTPKTLDLLDGVVRVYVVDYKFGSDRCAKSLAGIDRYTGVMQRNLRIVARRGQLIIRHLLMPGHLDCCLRPVAEWIADNLPAADFRLMEGYVPAWRAEGDARLGRTCSASELAEAAALVRSLGLNAKGESDVT